MKEYDPARLRNVALVSHLGAGKTSLTEALLFRTGAIQRLGRVEEGTTTTDYDPEESRRGMSINLALAPVEWRDYKINVIDAPGYADFFGEVVAALRAADAAVVLVDAVAGVQVGTEQVWRRASEAGLPRLVFVNKLERENASYDQALEALRKKFGPGVVPLVIPVGSQSAFAGVVDLVSRQAYLSGGEPVADVPGAVREQVDRYRELLIEAVCEVDDDLIAKYLEGEELSAAEITRALRTGVRAGRLFPVLCGSATQLRGLEPLLDAIVDLLPGADSVVARLADGGELPATDGRLAALVFKTVVDQFGRLNYVRVFSGEIRTDSHVWNANKGRDERIGQLYVLRGKQQEPVQKLGTGDIGALFKLQETSTGDTLTTKDANLVLAGLQFPEPTYSVAIQPKTKTDVDKLSTALGRLLEEDPTLRVQREPSTGETILSGLGESHVQAAVERMQRKYGVSVVVDVPRVPYRETVQSHARAEGRHVRQTGGAGQYGVVWLEIEPLPRGGEFEFVDKVVGGVVPRQFIPAVEKGVREALERGPLGFPVVDVRVSLVDGKAHPVDSNEQAFKTAGSIGFKAAAQKANPVLLEPIMEVTVTVPDEYTGAVIGDMNTRRARVLGMTPNDGTTVIEALVPLAEMLRYGTDLRSFTQDRGTFTMKFARYEEVPPHIAQGIIEKRRKELEGQH